LLKYVARLLIFPVNLIGFDVFDDCFDEYGNNDGGFWIIYI